MDLVNMIQENKSEGTTVVEVSKDSPPEPSYPYGLEITLEKESISKLGLDISAITIGDVLSLTAKVKVTRISMNQGTDNYASQSLSLQITDMVLGDTEPEGFEESFEEAVEKDKRIYTDLELKTSGGFKKSLYEATR